jgi:hypothetical protein
MTENTEVKWIDVKERLPSLMCCCLVTNSKGWMREIRAIFYPEQKVFILNDPNYRESLVLEVTHYIEIPEIPFSIHLCERG